VQRAASSNTKRNPAIAVDAFMLSPIRLPRSSYPRDLQPIRDQCLNRMKRRSKCLHKSLSGALLRSRVLSRALFGGTEWGVGKGVHAILRGCCAVMSVLE
jgi:hypothetical protein